jgi:hypothetical protein
MWLELYLVVLVGAWWHSLFHARLHIFFLLSVVYAFHYFLFVYNVSEPRSWSWLRSLSLWDHMHCRHLGCSVWAEGSNWADYESKGSRVFVVNATLYDVVAILLTFGLHGKEPKAMKQLGPLLVLPDHLFRYPVLANLLQWMGGVPFDKARLERLVKEDGHSLVIVLPAQDVLPHESDGELEEVDLEQGINGECAEACVLAEWLRTLPGSTQQPIKVVPVVYSGAEHFYLSPLSFLHFGLLFTCLPRAVSLRAGLGRAILLSPVLDLVEQGDERSSAAQILETIRRGHGYLAQVTRG